MAVLNMIKTSIENDFNYCMHMLEAEKTEILKKDLEIKRLNGVIDKLEKAVLKLVMDAKK